MEDSEIKEHVKKRYSEIAKSGESCCSSSCCSQSATDRAIRIGYSEDEISDIPEASIMGLGCGNPVALASLKEDEVVLDLGSGGGIDVFLAAKKVGANGRVVGIDMTGEMISRARASALEYGYDNVEFRFGEIENLPLEDESVDVVISNCVINLSPDKEKVFKESYRVLKTGGRLLVSDIVTEGELPNQIRKNVDAWTGCIAGALEKNQYLDTIKKAGFKKIKIASQSTFDLGLTQELRGRITSIQVEAFK